MTAWCVFVEVLVENIDDSHLEKVRADLVESVELATGLRPRVKTIQVSALNAAWQTTKGATWT